MILIPEIPYDIDSDRRGDPPADEERQDFSIVAVAEGAHAKETPQLRQPSCHADTQAECRQRGKARKKAETIRQMEAARGEHALKLARQLEAVPDWSAGSTILGYLQRGGTPSAADRLLATRLGTACADLVHEGVIGVMVAARGEGTEAMPLEEVVEKRKSVPLDHPWLRCARDIGVCLGDA